MLVALASYMCGASLAISYVGRRVDGCTHAHHVFLASDISLMHTNLTLDTLARTSVDFQGCASTRSLQLAPPIAPALAFVVALL